MKARIASTTVERTPTGSYTTLPCGAEIPATPHDTDGYRITAHLHGYGADTVALCQEHDLTHVALCAWLGLAVSPTLQAVVDGREFAHAGLEEDAVLAVQRFARAIGLDLWAVFAGDAPNTVLDLPRDNEAKS